MTDTTFGAEIVALGQTPHHLSTYLDCDYCTTTAETWVVDGHPFYGQRTCRDCWIERADS